MALGVVRSKQLTMQQDHDETFRTFAARVQEKEQTCEFKTSFDGSYSNCLAVYHGDVYYTEEVIRDDLLKGMRCAQHRQYPDEVSY